MNKEKVKKLDYYETVTKVTELLEAQGAGCTNYEVCMYRHEGMKCAVGMLIPDELYHKGLEEVTLAEAKRHTPEGSWAPVIEYLEERYSIEALFDCQDAHDFAALSSSPNGFIKQFKMRLGV